jgi:hypothetical protein
LRRSKLAGQIEFEVPPKADKLEQGQMDLVSFPAKPAKQFFNLAEDALITVWSVCLLTSLLPSAMSPA